MPLFRKRRERRKHSRHTVISTSWIEVGDGNPPLVCVLWDISESGARLAIASPEKLPAEFSLFASRGSRIGVRCRIVWRTEDQIGLQFLEDASPILRMVRVRSEPVA
jgi:hypothetical protein